LGRVSDPVEIPALQGREEVKLATGSWAPAIDALVAGDKTAANYHLAWFQAR
jgi:hypothetical protein